MKARFWDHKENCKLKSLLTLKMSVKDNSIQTCDWRQIKNLCQASHSNVLSMSVRRDNSIETCDWPVTVKVVRDIQNRNGDEASQSES